MTTDAPADEIAALRRDVERLRAPGQVIPLTLLEGFLERVRARGVEVLLCGVTSDFNGRLVSSGLAAQLGNNLFLEQPVRQTSTALAVRRAYELIPSPCATCPHRAALAGSAAPI